MADIGTITIELVKKLDSLRQQLRDGEIGREGYFPKLTELLQHAEEQVGEGGLEPWQLYKSLFADTSIHPTYRTTGINRLHDPTRVPEYAAQEIADTVVAVMQEPDLNGGLGLQTFMAASILSGYDPVTPVLPISREDLDTHILPYVESIPTVRQGQSQTLAELGQVSHTLASIARLTVVHDGAYDSLLGEQLDRYLILQEQAESELRSGAIPDESKQYVYGHSMEHLAELMDQATKTRDQKLVALLLEKGVFEKFVEIDATKPDHSYDFGSLKRHIAQVNAFSDVAGEMSSTHLGHATYAPIP